MLSYSVVILVCSVTTSHGDCRANTAIDVMRGPKVENLAACAFSGQALLASTELTSENGGEYVKIVCMPTERLEAIKQTRAGAEQAALAE